MVNISKETENAIREIIQDELKGTIIKVDNLRAFGRRKGDTPRERLRWSLFETELLANHFDKFCKEMATKTGRTTLSVACKTRNMMLRGQIFTW